jgi:hypothetical protein
VRNLDTEALERILAIGKLDTAKIEMLFKGLEEPRKGYLLLKSFRRAPPANEIAKICISISKITARLTKILDPDSRGAGQVNLLLERFGLEMPQTIETLHRLDFAAHEAAMFMRKGIKDIAEAFEEHFGKCDEEEIEEEDGHQLGEHEIKELIPVMVLVSSLLASNRKHRHREAPETKLFVELRELFINLGGSSALSSTNAYGFVKACAKTIDEEISIPSLPSFRKLLERAIRRVPA